MDGHPPAALPQRRGQMQAAGWYLLTTVGVMIASGVAFEWSWIDHLLAVVSIGSLTVLIVRHN